ncbi:MAG: energy transducer TonB [Bdellovibrionaceae bacterium]|nr:energy transducer TonB [Pseudobdellovibrionaceae bacterium]
MVEIIGQESSHSADINAPYPAETTIEESKKNKNTVKAVDTDQNQSSSGVNKSKQGLELKRVGAQSVSNSKAQFYSPIIPIYPAISKQLGEQGRVVLAVFIDTSGFVYKTEVKSSSGHVRLDNQAQKTVLGIKVKPAVKNGEPESSVLHIGLDFKLN